MSDPQKNTDLAAVRRDLCARLEGARGRDYWRSLDEVAATPEFQDLLEREFPRQAVGWSEDENPVEGRRNFLKLMGASLALAGMTACTRQPTEHIMPYVRQPEDLIPGRPLFFATATTLNGVASGVLVESHEGRPTKIEGNPEHPATLGACDPYSQASVLQLYDPDRSQALTYNGEIRSWSAFTGALRDALAQQKGKGGAGIRILTETITSPTLGAQFKAIQQRFPAAKWIQYEPLGSDNVRAGAKLAFGQYANPIYKLDAADVLVSLDADLFGTMQGSVRYARDYSNRRRAIGGNVPTNRFYAVETTPTHSGAKADHRLPIKPSQLEDFARSLAWAQAAGSVAVPLTLAPHESRFIVIGVLPAGAREPVPTVSTSQTVAGLGGPWSVTLGEKQLSSPLKSWEEMDAGTFAGTAVYKQEFTVAAALPQDKRVYLDLGDVHETARVQLNGTQLDARPWPPRRFLRGLQSSAQARPPGPRSSLRPIASRCRLPRRPRMRNSSVLEVVRMCSHVM